MALSQYQRQQRISIVEKLLSTPLGTIFSEIHPDDIPGYRDKIARPMDLKTVKRHLRDKSNYSNSNFKEEMKLIFSNCRKFNEGHDVYVLAADEVQRLFKHQMEKLEDTQEKQWKRRIRTTAEKLQAATKQLCKLINNSTKSQTNK